MPSLNREDPLASPYIPIDTDLVDNIHHYSADHIHVRIDYKDRDGEVKQMRGFIADVYTTKDSEEYLKMMDGRSIRLDQIVTVIAKEGKSRSNSRDYALDLEEKLNIEENKFFPNGIN